MINHFDLHVHTNASDGVYTPADIVRIASESDVETIAITDHDTVGGVEEGVETGIKMGVRVIPGVELSTQFGDCNGVHILGYFIDHTDKTLRDVLNEFQAVRLRRGEMIVEAINRHLIEQKLAPLSIERLKEVAQGSIGRPHISRLLVEMGYARNTNDAFQGYLIPFNIPKKKLNPQRAVRLINNAGGIAVLAHPHMWSESREKVSREEMGKRIRAIAHDGVVGLEAFYPGYSPEDAEFFCSQARELGLEITAGTDFHSPSHLGTPLGCFGSNLDIPTNLVDNLFKRYTSLIESEND